MIRRLLDLARDSAGAAMVEFAIVLPLLFITVFGVTQFGVLLNNYITVTDATEVGAQQFSISRGSTTTPLTDTVNEIYAFASNLCGAPLPTCASVLTVTLSVNGTACASDTACTTALNTAQGQPVKVTVSYPCGLYPGMATLLSFGSCALTSSLTARVQ